MWSSFFGPSASGGGVGGGGSSDSTNASTDAALQQHQQSQLPLPRVIVMLSFSEFIRNFKTLESDIIRMLNVSKCVFFYNVFLDEAADEGIKGRDLFEIVTAMKANNIKTHQCTPSDIHIKMAYGMGQMSGKPNVVCVTAHQELGSFLRANGAHVMHGKAAHDSAGGNVGGTGAVKPAAPDLQRLAEQQRNKRHVFRDVRNPRS